MRPSIAAAAVACRSGCRSGAETGAAVVVFGRNRSAFVRPVIFHLTWLEHGGLLAGGQRQRDRNKGMLKPRRGQVVIALWLARRLYMQNDVIFFVLARDFQYSL